MNGRSRLTPARRLGRLLPLLLVALLAGGCANASVRDYVRDEYERAEPADESERRSQVYTSSKPPTQTAADIIEHRKPADRRSTPSGIFLRYQRDFVAVVPAESGSGSRILIDDERRGYTHFYPFVGGYWGRYSGPTGSYSGRGESFRGGGPGSGK